MFTDGIAIVIVLIQPKTKTRLKDRSARGTHKLC